MEKYRFSGQGFIYPFLAICASSSVQAADLITVTQSGESVEWLVSSTTFPVDKVILKMTGPDQGTATIPAGCTAQPFICDLEFSAGSSPVMTTTGFSAGSYSWGTEIVPAVSDTSACGTQASVRESDGGNQGLDGGVVATAGEQYIECIRAQGLLPSDSQDLLQSGSFNIAMAGTLVVPPSTPPTVALPDNEDPVAQCQDVTIEGDAVTCQASADVNNGSYDPDGTLVSILQDPAGPFSLGVTSVELTVTDDFGSVNSCSANVTVTDTQAPAIQCQTYNITPPDSPITFTATTTDSCSTPVTQVVAYDCYRFNKKGKRIDTTDSCVVSIAGSSVTIEETSGVSSFIDWTVEAVDSSGNQSTEVCTIEVTKPGKN